MKPATDESDFLGLMIDVVVEISRVRSGGNEHNNDFAVLAFLVAFFDPFADFSAVRRVAEHSRSCLSPFLRKTVIFNSIVSLALSVLVRTAWIKVEMELRIQLLIEVGRSCPLITVR